MSRQSTAYALVEDKRHRQFIYRFLLYAGFNRNKIIVDISPSGQGSGKQWVRKRFAQQVETCRKRNAKTSTCMFAMMDADQLTVAKCKNDLDAGLIEAGQAKLDPSRDPIARLIPKWSIETWIVFLGSNGAPNLPLSEDKSYKESKRPEQWAAMIPPAARVLLAWLNAAQNRPDDVLDSLQRSLDEIPRALSLSR